MSVSEWINFQTYILQLEQEGKVTRTFRRLDPERQEAILNAIFDEAAEKGPAGINIKEIAQRAGVSVGSMYQYFPDRDGLLDFAVELSVRSTVAMFREYQPMLAAMPLKEGLASYLMGGLEWGRALASLVRFLGRAAYQGDPDLAERLVRPIATVMRETMQQMLEQAAGRGELRSDLDLEATARAVNAMLIAAGDSQLLPYLNVYFQVSDKDHPAERTAQALLDLVLRGIAARSS